MLIYRAGFCQTNTCLQGNIADYIFLRKFSRIQCPYRQCHDETGRSNLYKLEHGTTMLIRVLLKDARKRNKIMRLKFCLDTLKKWTDSSQEGGIISEII